MRILINAVIAKKRSSGGFQVCINFILRTLEQDDIEWYYIVSEELDKVIGRRMSYIKNRRYFVFPSQPDFLHSYWHVYKAIRKLEDEINPNVVFSILAPSYFQFKTKEVMRYTQPWVTHPNQFAWESLSFKKLCATKMYCMIQRILIRKAHYFITQSETCAKGILKITHEQGDHVIVIPNVLPAIFSNYNIEHIDSDGINIACVGSAYYHKNIDIVPDVLLLLKVKGYNVKCHLTLPQKSTLFNIIRERAINLGVDENIVNHGVLTQSELGDVYRKCDLCFLPSLLEVFSATTIEAMFFGLPVVATNIDFNKEILGESCLYYEPTNARDAASKLQILIENNKLREECRMKMKLKKKQFCDFDSYFNNTRDFLLNVAAD